MTWNLEYRDDLQIVVLTYLGKVSGPEIQEAAIARIDLGKEKGVTKFLIDTKNVETADSATMRIHEIPGEIYPDKKIDRTSQIAILGPKSPVSKKMVKFFETSCVNRGWRVDTFQDYESAIEWLGLSPTQQETERDK